VTIGNGLVAMKIYTPDAQKGLYIGSRFDWAGIVGSLTYKGQEYYGPWVDMQAPDTKDFVFVGDGGQHIVVGQGEGIGTGPIEEFYDENQQPLGYDLAKPGGTFVKIGVGVLRRIDDAPYDHFRLYPIVDGGKRTMHVTKTSITFTQDVSDPSSGFGYSYSKTLRLAPGKAELVLEHHLRNTGTKPIDTMVFDHNFLKLSEGNENLQITLPFTVVSDPPPPADMVKIDGNKISYIKPMTDTMRVKIPIAGFGKTAKDYEAQIVDTRTGFGMSFKGDLPLSDMHVWSIRNVMGLVPLVSLGSIAPGAQKNWNYTYNYFDKSAK
jgi:hypothetical protein